ncbi:hypothetical protein PAECIP111892_03256 [Paenibacillus auburnensis]|uniref:Flagellin n=1 Tax=Paenibacillus auburnensis TaxID=2905649 RepID=A0ABM9CCY0_9BACL|nr:flagellin [Paenibacillus auburnensis]CAH1209577.1 hypothetical protein PAECIP111892_03256 [Paenibacillus auburnensis]
MIINHNITALNTHRQLSSNSAATSKNIEKLSSGLRINRAGDDAAGLAISEKMRGQIRGLDMASKNAQDGISLIQTAEGALSETHSILQRVRELSVQSANGTNTEEDRKALQSEVGQLKEEIDRIGNTTEFNTKKLLNGALKSAGAVVGANSTTSSVVAKLTSGSMTSAGSLKANQSTVTFEKDTFEIDGHHIDVNWDTLLTQAQKDSIDTDLTNAGAASLKNIKDTLVGALNTAIDNYNSTNAAGATVGHLNGYLDASNKIVLESSSTGKTSTVGLFTSGAATSVGSLILSNTAGAVSGGAGTYAANAGTMKYSGQTVTAKKLDFEVNGVKLQTAAVTITNGADMDAQATALQTALQTAITKYNTDNGLTGKAGYIEDVKVTASQDGRFEITNETGALTFNEQEGETSIKDLGLTQAQTDASGNGGVTFQIGANKGQSITFGVSDMRSAALGIAGVDISTTAGASASITSLDKAISSVSSERAKLGAVQNRLEHTINNLNTSSENLTAAESRVRDVDMAKEMMEQTKNNILAQAAQAMLAQANQQPQGVLQLLR